MSRRRAVVGLLAGVLASGPALAHSSSKGLGNFFGGAVHPLLEPAHLVVLLAFALFLGQRGLEERGPAVPSFIAGLLPALVVAGAGWRPDTDTPLLALAALAGAAVAAAAAVPEWLWRVACPLAGAGIGLASAPEASTLGARVSGLCGSGAGALAWLVLGAAVVQQAKRPWAAILVRVAGSWTAACAVLVLSLWFAGHHHKAVPVDPSAATQTGVPLDVRR